MIYTDGIPTIVSQGVKPIEAMFKCYCDWRENVKVCNCEPEEVYAKGDTEPQR